MKCLISPILLFACPFAAHAVVNVVFVNSGQNLLNGQLEKSGSGAQTWTNVGGLGFDIFTDGGGEGDRGISINSDYPTVTLSFFVTGTTTPLAVTGLNFRIDDVEGASEAIEAISFFESGQPVATEDFTDGVVDLSTRVTLDSTFMIVVNGVGAYDTRSAVSGFTANRGLAMDLSDLPITSFSVTGATSRNPPFGITLSQLGTLTPVPEPTHFGLSFAVVAALAAFLRRKCSR